MGASASGLGGCLPHPLGRHPPGQTPPWADTPLGRQPPRQTTPQADNPPGRHPCSVHARIHPLAQCMLGYTLPCTVHAGIWSTSRLYASHWNAFLFHLYCWQWKFTERGTLIFQLSNMLIILQVMNLPNICRDPTWINHLLHQKNNGTNFMTSKFFWNLNWDCLPSNV